MSVKRGEYPPGQRFHRWTVIERAEDHVETTLAKVVMLSVRCDCGTVANIRASSIRLGRSKSCGCLRNELARKRAMGNQHYRNFLAKAA